jgi:DNA excision repair protein ERCC-2
VLFPAIKALAAGKHDAVAFVTSRVLGRRAAEQALDLMREAGLECNALSLSARDSVCLSPGCACHPDDCPYAAGYYDRLPAALAEGLAGPRLRREELLELARSHRVCPWQLGLDFLPWVDLVIADLHYLYSLTALLAGRMWRDQRRWSVLLDEAHNLPGRARGLFRAELSKRELLEAKRASPPALSRALARINRIALALQKEDWQAPDFDCRERPPARLEEALAAYVSAAGEAAAEDPLVLQRWPEARELLFKVLQFQRVMEHWGEDFRFELHRGDGRQGLRLVLNCLDPARLLAATQSRLHSVTAFSATLSPAQWARRALGLGAGAVCSRQASPFDSGQLLVHLATGIDTRYRSRAASLPALVALLARWLAERPGNCIIYFPSYRYLQDALDALSAAGGPVGRTLWVQRPGSSATHPELLERLAQRRDVAAFCILGGAFGEGIDLPGEQLTSVVVVGVGLPQVNRDTEALRRWHQDRGRDGFAHAYLYPGMQRVDQALGRVVRSATDRGHALLIDSRYGEADYRRLLPPWWTYRDDY